MGWEGLSTDFTAGDADTTDGSWVETNRAGGGLSAGVNLRLYVQYKLPTGTSSQTYNPTLNSTRQWSEILAVLNAAAPTDVTVAGATMAATAAFGAGGGEIEIVGATAAAVSASSMCRAHRSS